jgi:GT2 family glycosyltransferase
MGEFVNRPLVSIVSLCWNRKDEILESLAQIHTIDYPHLEVIVVDNASNDGTAEAIEGKYPGVRLLRMFKNIGIEAYNIGFKNAHGDYIVILDDDSFPHPQAISNMVAKFEADPQLGIVAFDVRNACTWDAAQAEQQPIPTPAGASTAAEAEGYLLAFNGAGAGIRRDLFERVGYYPEEFFLYWNEQDTAFRVLQAGYRIRFFTDVIAYHKYAPTNRTSWRAPFYYTRNAFWLIWKNYPFSMAIHLTVRMMYKCFYASLEQHTLIYLRAMLRAFLDAGAIKNKRSPVDPKIAHALRIPFDVAFTFYR